LFIQNFKGYRNTAKIQKIASVLIAGVMLQGAAIAQ
jgi:hypothetical protein